MTRQLASITLAAFLTALLSIEISTAQAKQQCSAAMPSNPQGHWWSYRLIDGRKCWYEGKPGLSKSLLEWPTEVSAQPASGEQVTSAVPEIPLNLLDSQAWAPSSKAWAPAGPDTFEKRWRARAIETGTAQEVSSVTGARPATPKVDDDDGPPLRKGDKLQPPYADSRQAKSIRTLVVVPDSAAPGQTKMKPNRSLETGPSE
jgi:hypothetical protein